MGDLGTNNAEVELSVADPPADSELAGRDDSDIYYRPLPYKEAGGKLFGILNSDMSLWENACVKLGALHKLIPVTPFVTMVDYADDAVASLRSDVIAGTTVGIMVIPQGMAYAMIAGLPNEYGLYASFVPLVVYAMLGSSRQLAVGPVAIISLLTKASLSSIVPEGTDDYDAKYVQAALMLALLSGLAQVLLGVLRLGFVVNLMSHCVISGFTSAAAVLIGMSQLKYVFGFKIEHTETVQGAANDIAKGLRRGQFHTASFVISLSMIAFLIGMKHAGRRYKKLKMLRAMGPLIVSILGALLVYAFRWDDTFGISIVGKVPTGLPPLSLDKLDFGDVGNLIPKALIIAMLGFVESIAIAQQLATKNSYELDVNQELFGVGIANVVGSCFSSYAVTGSFSRSAVNNDSGAKSTLASLVTASVVLLALLLLSRPLYYLPKSALAAIVISSVTGLIDVQEVKFLRQIHPRDMWLWYAACFGTLILGVELGIAVAVSFSLACVIYETAKPHTAILGQIPGTNVYRSTKQYPDSRVHRNITILRIDAPLYFANVNFVKDKIRSLSHAIAGVESAPPGPEGAEASEGERTVVDGEDKFIILEMGPVITCDSSGAHALKDIVQDCRRFGIQLCMSNPNGGVLHLLERAEVINAMGRDWLFLRTHDAVQACIMAMQELGFGDGGTRVSKQGLQHRAKRTDSMD